MEDAVPCGSVRRLPFINTRIPSLNVSMKFTWKSVLIESDGAPLQPVSDSGFAVHQFIALHRRECVNMLLDSGAAVSVIRSGVWKIEVETG